MILAAFVLSSTTLAAPAAGASHSHVARAAEKPPTTNTGAAMNHKRDDFTGDYGPALAGNGNDGVLPEQPGPTTDGMMSTLDPNLIDKRDTPAVNEARDPKNLDQKLSDLDEANADTQVIAVEKRWDSEDLEAYNFEKAIDSWNGKPPLSSHGPGPE